MFTSKDELIKLKHEVKRLYDRVLDLEKPKNERFFTCKRKDCGQVFESWYHPRPKVEWQQQYVPPSVWDGLSRQYIGGAPFTPTFETEFCKRCHKREQQDNVLLAWAKDNLDQVNKLKEEDDECL